MTRALTLCAFSLIALFVSPLFCDFPLTLPVWFMATLFTVMCVTLLGACEASDNR